MFSFDESQLIKGLRSCLENADRLVQESDLLYGAGHLERSLALAVLALEELGKLICINGLAFSLTHTNQGEESFHHVRKTHQAKLSALYSFPLVIFQFAGLNEHVFADEMRNKSIHKIIQDFHSHMERLEPWIGGIDNLEGLNRWKQRALYVDFDDEQGFTGPSGCDPELVTAVQGLARHMVDGLKKVLLGNLDRYAEAIRAIRRTVTPEEFSEIQRWITEELKQIRG
ncbi:MAG: AbiV family abortive infection protein [Bacillota bacterium]